MLWNGGCAYTVAGEADLQATLWTNSARAITSASTSAITSACIGSSASVSVSVGIIEEKAVTTDEAARVSRYFLGQS